MEEKFKLLSIDDDKAFCSIFDLELKSSYPSIETQFAHRANLAFDFLSNNPSSFPDLIVLDLNLPGMTGLEFLEKYLESNFHKLHDTKIVVVSSLASAEEYTFVNNLPVVIGLIEKPISSRKLAQILGTFGIEDITTSLKKKLPANNTKRSIVIVDDNSASNTIIGEYIRSIDENIELNAFNNELEAIHFLNGKVQKNEMPDILLVDVRMPNIDGFEFVELLENAKIITDEKPKVIMYSNFVTLADERKAHKHKSIAEITEKPLSFAEFKKLFERFY